MRTYSQFFSWNRNVHLVDFCHLTTLLKNEQETGELSFFLNKKSWKRSVTKLFFQLQSNLLQVRRKKKSYA